MSAGAMGSIAGHYLPFATLLKREILRFMTVSVQTLLSPVITSSLYLFIFGVGLGGGIRISGEYGFVEFVIPGLILMGVVTNAFQNSSSSLFFSRYIGNIVDYLVMPLPTTHFLLAFTLAAMVRGLLVGVVTLAVSIFFSRLPWPHPGYAIAMIVLASLVFSLFGLVAAVYSGTWDHLAVFGNFLLMPMVFLGGVFYPVSRLPELWARVSKTNPIFYLIDGFRYGALGVSEHSPAADLMISAAVSAAFFVWAFALIRSGYRIKS